MKLNQLAPYFKPVIIVLRNRNWNSPETNPADLFNHFRKPRVVSEKPFSINDDKKSNVSQMCGGSYFERALKK